MISSPVGAEGWFLNEAWPLRPSVSPLELGAFAATDSRPSHERSSPPPVIILTVPIEKARPAFF
jgi:hypothetical protein